MMYQFTYGDPDGNGKDDTYGLCMCKYTGPLDIIQAWFGAGNQWKEVDGKLVPVHQTEEYLEALKWMKKMYDDGLIYKDWANPRDQYLDRRRKERRVRHVPGCS